MNLPGRGDPIAIIGCGRVGSTLACALSDHGWSVAHLASSSRASADRLAGLITGSTAHATPQEAADAADLVLLTVPDDAISAVANSISWTAEHHVIHCSGSLGLDVLPENVNRGSFHPIMTIPAEPTQGILDGATVAIDGDDGVLDLLERMANDVGGRPVRIKPEDRVLYHLSCLLVGGYLSSLGAEAAGLWSQMGFDPKRGIEALAPMISQVGNNLGEQGIPSALQGTVHRGDVEAIRAHLAVIDERCPHLRGLYVGLAETSLRQAIACGAIDDNTASVISELLASA
ncbi:MAG: DUF2520 domain-containing protein [Phycisphaerales bacterium]|nr:DUF2520 domain-containing protein [Phycisphaerales bacterium]